MKKKIKEYLPKVMLILLLIIVTLQLRKNYQKVEVEQTFTSSLNIKNNTFYRIDGLSEILAGRVLCYDSLNVIITYMNQESFSGGLRLRAFVVKQETIPKTYIIYMSRDLSEDSIIETLCHEFAHIEQFESKRLQIIDQYEGIFLYEGIVINLKLLPYHLRIHEYHARKRGSELNQRLWEELYGRKTLR